MDKEISAREWTRRFAARPPLERAGAYEIRGLPRLPLKDIAALSKKSGVHPDVLGPCRRAAAKLNWFIMVRPIKASAMFHVGDFNKLPKPMAIKAKCHPSTGMVMLKNEADFKRALSDGRIDPGYARVNGLHIAPKPTFIQGRPLHFLFNKKGQRFFSDMDLYEVLNGTTGRQVQLGRGGTPTQGIKNRRELDILINTMRGLGTDFGLVQHGPDRQWVKHDHSKPNTESVTVFCPDGKVFILSHNEVIPFIQAIGQSA